MANLNAGKHEATAIKPQKQAHSQISGKSNITSTNVDTALQCYKMVAWHYPETEMYPFYLLPMITWSLIHA